MKIKIFNFLSKIVTNYKICPQKLSSDHETVIVFGTFWETLNIKSFFNLPSNFVYMSSRKTSQGNDAFSVNKLENNNTLIVFVAVWEIY